MATFTRRAAVLALGSATAVLAGIAGPITSASAALSVPADLSPNSAGADPTDPVQIQKDPLLSWDAVTGATSYTVEMSKNDNWNSTDLIGLPNDGVTNVTTFAPPSMLPHGAYFWRVKATSGSSSSGWATAQLYKGWFDAPTLGPDPGADATADWSSDPNGVDSAPFRLTWQAMPDASSYEVEVSTTSNFPPTGTIQEDKAQTSVECITTHTSFTPYGSAVNKDTNVDDCDFSSMPSASPYYWRVRGLDDSTTSVPDTSDQGLLRCVGLSYANGGTTSTTDALGSPASTSQDCSQWSPTGQLTFPTLGSGAFTLADLGNATPNVSLAPSCTGVPVSCTDTPEIRWTPLAVASSITASTEYPDHYRVTIADDPSFKSIERAYDTSLLTLTPRDEFREFNAGQGYYVSVQACDAEAFVPPGQQSGCGAPSVLHFLKHTPAVSGLAATALPNGGGVQFVWNDLLGKYPAASSGHGQAGVEAMDYIVQVAHSGDTDFSNPLLQVESDRTCDTANVVGCYHPGVSAAPGKAELVRHLGDGDYRWRVVPVDLAGNHLTPSASQLLSVDSTAPRLHLTDTRTGHGLTSAFHIAASESVVGANSSTLTIRPVIGSSSPLAGTLTKTGATTWTFAPSHKLVTGQSYMLDASGITDTAGNAADVTGSPVRTVLTADDSSTAWHYSSGWKKVTASGALGGTFRRGAKGSSATVQLVGKTLSVYACKAPHSGRLKVQVNGTVVAAPSLAQSFTKCGLLVYRGDVSSNRVNTVRVIAARGPVELDRVKIS